MFRSSVPCVDCVADVVQCVSLETVEGVKQRRFGRIRFVGTRLSNRRRPVYHLFSFFCLFRFAVQRESKLDETSDPDTRRRSQPPPLTHQDPTVSSDGTAVTRPCQSPLFECRLPPSARPTLRLTPPALSVAVCRSSAPPLWRQANAHHTHTERQLPGVSVAAGAAGYAKAGVHQRPHHRV